MPSTFYALPSARVVIRLSEYMLEVCLLKEETEETNF